MILKNIRKKYEDHHSVSYSDAILEECVLLSERYITDRYLPDKAIDIMDEVGSRIHIKKASYPDEIKEMEERMKKFDEHKFGLCVSCDSGLDDRADFAPDPRFPRGFALMCNACVDYYNKAGYVGCGYGPFSNAAFQ
jgi:hypothetical protein